MKMCERLLTLPYRSDPDQPMEQLFVVFLGSEAAQLLEQSTILDNTAIYVRDPERTYKLFEEILQQGPVGTYYSEQICCNYLRIILLQQADDLGHLDPCAPFSSRTYRRCRRYIAGNFAVLKSPGEAAEKCGVNVRYMSALFKKHGDCTPSEYIQRLKLNKAANLLLSTNLSVKETAARVGFNDPYYFSRVFKKFHGESPLNYRKSNIIKLP